MVALLKEHRLTSRFTEEQRQRLVRACGLLSRLRGEAVKPGTLIREATMGKVEEILAADPRAA